MGEQPFGQGQMSHECMTFSTIVPGADGGE